jgi:hypothetical protein
MLNSRVGVLMKDPAHKHIEPTPTHQQCTPVLMPVVVVVAAAAVLLLLLLLLLLYPPAHRQRGALEEPIGKLLSAKDSMVLLQMRTKILPSVEHWEEVHPPCRSISTAPPVRAVEHDARLCQARCLASVGR